MASDTGGPRTLIVKGLGPEATEESFGSFFSDLGPVLRSFLVRQGKGGPHKGFGFVQYALPEDAKRAVAKLDGKRLDGQRLKVDFANKRASAEERRAQRKPRGGEEAPGAEEGQAKPAAQAKPPPPPKRARAAIKGAMPASEKHKLVRAVAVAGPEAGDEAALRALLGAGLAEELESARALPLELYATHMLARDGCPAEGVPTRLLVFKSTPAAFRGVAALHAPAAGRWARQVSGDGLHLKRWRLVVRNLPFSATEQALREAFSKPGGFVWEVTLPRSASGRGRGFAFVGFQSMTDAQRAIAAVNGTSVAGRVVAVDWALSKSDYQQQARLATAAPEGVMQDVEDDASGDDAAPAAGPYARSSSSSSSEEEEKEDADEEDADEDAAPKDEHAMQANVLSALLGKDDEEEEVEEDDAVVEDEGALADTEEEEEDDKDTEEPAAVAAPAIVPKRTLAADGAGDIFGKSSLAAVAASVPSAPAAARPLLTKPTAGASAPADEDEASARLRRTVFVRGLPLDVLKDQVWDKFKAFGRLRACRLVMDKDTGKPKGTAFVEYWEEPGAQAAAAAARAARDARGAGVAVGGRQVDVDVALDRDGARGAAAAQQGARKEARDRRNLHLAKEGLIAEGSPAWEGMSPADQAKRRRAALERKTKLASPNFVLSPTRLNVRNVPPSWDEAQLKRAFIAAVKRRATKALPRVRHAKILREAERLDADGNPASKGIAFVEFEDHEHALCALRELNNNPDAFARDRRPIVEFAIDNVKILRAREDRAARRAAQGGGEPGGADADAPASKRQLRRERSKNARQVAEAVAVDREESAAPAALSKSQRRRLLRQKKGQEGDEQEAAPAPEQTLALDRAVDLGALRGGKGAAAAPKAPGVVLGAGRGGAKPGKGPAAKRLPDADSSTPPAKRPRAETHKVLRQPTGKALPKGNGVAKASHAAPSKVSKSGTPKPEARLAAKPQAMKRKAETDIKVTSRRAGAKKTDKGEEKLDALIADYRTKLLGGGGKSKAKQGKPGQSLKRWFE